MTTQQLDRPLSQVDETAERIQTSSQAGWGGADEERATWDRVRAQETIRRIARDPGSLLRAGLITATMVILVAVSLWRRRRPPPSTSDVLLDRARESFERAREALDATAAKLTSLDR
jgi:hypothetical protein